MPVTKLILRSIVSMTLLCALHIMATRVLGERRQSAVLAFVEVESVNSEQLVKVIDVDTRLLAPNSYRPNCDALGCSSGCDILWSSDRNRLLYAQMGSDQFVELRFGSSEARSFTSQYGAIHTFALSPDEQQVAYVLDGYGQTAVYIMNADGSEQRLLSTFPDGRQIGRLVWSSNGQQLAIDVGAGQKFSDIGTYILDIVELRIKWVVDGRVIQWSLDGQSVLFSSSRGNDNDDIYVTNLATGEERRLSSSSMDEWYARWSPDNTRIAFLSSRGDREHIGISVMDADGTNLHPMPHPEFTAIYGLTWSPDGTRLAFLARNGPTISGPLPVNPFDLYVLDLYGNSLGQIRQGNMSVSGSTYFCALAWRP